MPDFNKGDFTQQGVDGHVTAALRLNEKRIVNIDLTSNEDAEGVTVSGTVTDRLNGKVYDICSGGGSFPVCEVTFINEMGEGHTPDIYSYLDSALIISNGIVLNNAPVTETSDTFDLLYKFANDPSNLYYVGFITNGIVTNLVNCQLVDDGYWSDAIEIIDITANSSFTLTAPKLD